mgnify:CR=1 FL=1
MYAYKIEVFFTVCDLTVFCMWKIGCLFSFSYPVFYEIPPESCNYILSSNDPGEDAGQLRTADE